LEHIDAQAWVRSSEIFKLVSTKCNGLWFYHNLDGCHRVLARWFFSIRNF